MVGAWCGPCVVCRIQEGFPRKKQGVKVEWEDRAFQKAEITCAKA